jgi:CheY-like chemotaxis protein
MKKIFYCDDEEVNLKLMKAIFDRTNEDLHISNCPMDAYRLIRDNYFEALEGHSKPYNLLLTDFRMIGNESLNGDLMNNGISLSKAAYKVDPALPIIILSGSFADQDLIKDGKPFVTLGSLEHKNKLYYLPLLNQNSIRSIRDIGRNEYFGQLEEYALENGFNIGIPETNVVAGIAKPLRFRELHELVQEFYR